MPGSHGTYPYFKFSTVEDIITAIDNFKTVSMDCFGEQYQCSSTPCFRQIFEPIKDQFRSRNNATRIYHLPIDYLVFHTQALFVKYAALFVHKANEHIDVAAFRDLCISTLTIDTQQWRSDKGCDDMGCIPAQVVAPPGFKIDIPKVARVEKYSREERKEYKTKQQAGRVKDLHKKVKAQAKIPAVVVNPPAAGAKKGLCLKDLLHKKDPAEFPSPCPRPDVQCKFRHGVHLTAAGKLNPADKTAVLTGMAAMVGPFAEQARTYIELHL